MLELFLIVHEGGIVHGAAQDLGGPLVAGEGGGNTEHEEVQRFLINAEGPAVVDIERGQ